MGMNVVVVQDAALSVLDECKIRHQPVASSLHVVDAAELARGLTTQALRAGAVLLNLTSLEDLSVHAGRVSGVVVNRTTLLGALPIDPITLRCKAVIDATGHDAVAVEKLSRRGMLKNLAALERHREGPMDALHGEAFVVDQVAEVVGYGHECLRGVWWATHGTDFWRHNSVGLPSGGIAAAAVKMSLLI